MCSHVKRNTKRLTKSLYVFFIKMGWENGVRFPVCAEIFVSRTLSKRLWHPLSILCSGYRELFPRRKTGWNLKLMRQLVKTVWGYTSASQYLMAWWLFKDGVCYTQFHTVSYCKAGCLRFSSFKCLFVHYDRLLVNLTKLLLHT